MIICIYIHRSCVLETYTCIFSSVAKLFISTLVCAARLNNKFYCEHCGQGNGAPPDVCGNPFQDSRGVNFTDPTSWFDGFKATWQSGQKVDITITLSTNHGGRMAVRLCPRDRFGIYPSCFSEPANQLRRVSTDP
ncbi:hypothetical protein Vafri_3328, partial [Volvox africanus]